jgi:hypothetical protein
MSEEAVARTDEEKAKMYQAMLDGANVITSVLDADNEYGNDLTNVEKQERFCVVLVILSTAKLLAIGGQKTSPPSTLLLPQPKHTHHKEK